MAWLDRHRDSPRQRPPNYLSRPVQTRLLILVTLFALTILLMNEARKPENWRWMWRGQQAPTALPSEDESSDHVNTRLPDQAERRATDAQDVFRALKPPELDAPEGLENSEARFFPGVEPRYLGHVEDDRVLRRSDRKAWFNLLEVLKNTEQRALKNASLGPTGFVQLFQQPIWYRGQLVDVEGTVHSVHQVFAPKNENGIDHYFICWMRPSGGANSPMVAYVLELPKGFPLGDDVHEDAEFTGFFFKRLAYVAKDGSRTAPLLLAKTAYWARPTPNAASTVESLGHRGWIVLVGLMVSSAAAVAVGLAALVYWESQRRRPLHAYRGSSRATPETFAHLENGEAYSDEPEA